MTPNTASILVYDSGLFLPLAHKLAERVGKVYYYSPWEQAFPMIDDASVGDGYDDIERINEPLTVAMGVDAVVFPDVLFSDLQQHLKAMGVPVWGSMGGAQLELNRTLFRSTLRQVDLNVPSATVARGLSELRELLMGKDDCYIKTSFYRGSFETTHWRSWKEDSTRLDAWSARFGPVGEHVTFIVCDAIDTPLEIGGDTYCVNGQWPATMLHGIEKKDASYLGAVTRRDDMPEVLKDVFDSFGPVLGDNDYRNFWSMEVRVRGKEAFCTDATARMGAPSGASQLELWANLADIILSGANGVLVEPEPLGMFSAEVMLTVKPEQHAWTTIEVPRDLRQCMKLSFCCEVDGLTCFSPKRPSDGEIGWLVAIGDTPREAIKELKEYAKALPEGVSANVASLADVLGEIEQEQDAGIEFTDAPLPKPAVVLET